MPETADVAVAQSTPIAAVDAPRGFVQLPTDTQRSTVIGYHRGFAGARPLPGFVGEHAAAAIGALCAVLFRYTQQETIDIELCGTLLSCPIAADMSVGDAVAHAATGIISARDDGKSNIAVSLVDIGDARPEVFDEPDQHDIHFAVRAEPPMLECVYNAHLFEAATIDRLVDAVVRVFEVTSEKPATPIAELPVLSPADLHTIAVEWDSGHAEYPDEPVHRVFERLAAKQPDALAVSFEKQSLTYGELDALSNRLAHHLLASGVRPGGAVAVCVHPSLDIVVAFLAIWKAGAVYVPLDPTHPQALIAAILSEVEPGMVLTQSALCALANPQKHAQFCFDSDRHRIAALPGNPPAIPVTLDDPAYVLYTSGTTGRPKGVDARHANLAHYIHVAQQKYGFGPADVFCSLARYTFSISLFELVSPLCCGGSLRLLSRDDVLAPNRLADWLDIITVIHAGPSLLGNLFRYLRSSPADRQTFPRMRHASSGGDLVPPTLLEEMKRVFENAELFVIYGCTEISCMGCTYAVSRDREITRTFVGKPFPDVVVRVTDPQGNPLPFGAVGEICFAGKGVVRGYLHRPELTAEKFAPRQGMRFYHTGDMGRLHPDGNIEILGRRDYQVQLRGIRVELPGIENTVRAIGLAEQCAVVVKKLSDQDVRLIAFAVKPCETSIAGFRRALAEHLPDYMLPQALVTIDALPVTRNGKLDRNALQELPWESASDGSPKTAPRTVLERRIADAFAKALGVADVGIDDDFFGSGGHSLLAVALLLELENVLGRNLPPGVVFERPTVRALAEHAEDSTAHAIRPIPLCAARDKPALFMLMGVQLYKALAKRLEGHYSVYGVYCGRELTKLDRPESFSVHALATEYIRIIRQQQPAGPYRIGGISFGGVVAYEVAQQLRAAGESVDLLALMDAVLPESGLWHRMGQLARVLTLGPGEMLRVAADRVQTRFPGLFKSRPKSEFIRYATEGQVGAIEQFRMSAYADAAIAYTPTIQPYAETIELIVAGRRLKRDPLLSRACGWRGLARSLNLHVLDADHFDLVEEPMVAAVAEIFLRASRPMEAPGREVVGYGDGALAELDVSDGIFDPQT